jgi:hypothetical protein
MRMLRAVLIDPFKKAVEDIEIKGDGTAAILDEVYRLIGCHSIDLVVLTDRDALYVDDDGLRILPNGPFFVHRGYDQPLAGRGLVLGYDRAGDSVSTSLNADVVRPNIAWADDVVYAGSEPIPPGVTVDHPIAGPDTPVFGETPVFRPKRTN